MEASNPLDLGNEYNKVSGAQASTVSLTWTNNFDESPMRSVRYWWLSKTVWTLLSTTKLDPFQPLGHHRFGLKHSHILPARRTYPRKNGPVDVGCPALAAAL